MSKPLITQKRLKELLRYDPETGAFTWLVSVASTVPAGSIAGTAHNRGYWQIAVDRKLYLAHRLAFLYMTGSFPPDEVDHINRVRNDNRWSNLRPATAQENSTNQGLRQDNTSGHRGASWDCQRRKWQAKGTRGGRQFHLGRFDSLEEAAAVAKAWRENNLGEFAIESR